MIGGFFSPIARITGLNDDGSGFPARLSSSGLGSKVSTWLGPPSMKRKMTLLALGGWCGRREGVGSRESGVGEEARSGLFDSSDESAMAPKPVPALRSISRRVE